MQAQHLLWWGMVACNGESMGSSLHLVGYRVENLNKSSHSWSVPLMLCYCSVHQNYHSISSLTNLLIKKLACVALVSNKNASNVFNIQSHNLHEIIWKVPFKVSFIKTIISNNVAIEKNVFKFLLIFLKLNIPAYDWFCADGSLIQYNEKTVSFSARRTYLHWKAAVSFTVNCFRSTPIKFYVVAHG